MKKTIDKLPLKFEGVGKQKGYDFEKIKESDKAYLYRKTSGVRNIFEVFYKKEVAKCLDFDKRIYSETEFKEVYPNENHFGKWAWCVMSYEKALERFNNINNAETH